MTGWTIVTRDSPWSDEQREEMLALELYESGLCSCGWHESLTQDKANHFTFTDKHCPVCRGTAQYARVQAEQDQRATKALGDTPDPAAPRPTDGRRTIVRMMGDAEVATRAEDRARR